MLRAIAVILLIGGIFVGSSYAGGNAAAGKDLFTAKCAMCHGADGAGNTAMGKKFNIQNLRAPEIQKRSDAELSTSISKGKNKMPAFEGKLTPDEINNVIAHIRELPKQK